jgi:hypothetical protein
MTGTTHSTHYTLLYSLLNIVANDRYYTLYSLHTTVLIHLNIVANDRTSAQIRRFGPDSVTQLVIRYCTPYYCTRYCTRYCSSSTGEWAPRAASADSVVDPYIA